MNVTSLEQAPTLRRGDGVESAIVHSEWDDPETDLTATWVRVEPAAAQAVHSHDPEQVYVIVAGEGLMTVDGEERPVSAGDLIHVPSNADHGIENTGGETLEYVSAATPAFPMAEVEEFYEG